MLSLKNQASTTHNALGASNAKTVIGAETVIEGTVKLEESIFIQGKVYGDMNGNEVVTLDTTGVVVGNINCQNLNIAGRVVGNVQGRVGGASRLQPLYRTVRALLRHTALHFIFHST